MVGIVIFQLGKNGLSEEFIEQLRKSFKRHENVKISLLKSYSRDKNKITEDAEKICSELGCKFKLLGYTLMLKRGKTKKVFSAPKIQDF